MTPFRKMWERNQPLRSCLRSCSAQDCSHDVENTIDDALMDDSLGMPTSRAYYVQHFLRMEMRDE